MTTRRDFLRTVAAGAAMGSTQAWLGAQTPSDPWADVPRILARIQPPRFPSRDFDVTKYGAVGDNARDNSTAFRDAIAA